MARKNRRLSSASPDRYFLKRNMLNMGRAVGQALWHGGLTPDVIKVVQKVSEEETQNWYTNYQLYNKVKQIVKDYCNQEGIPSRLQGLLMAYAEKIVANWYIDYKGQSLSSLYTEYARKLGYNLGTGLRYTYTFTSKVTRTTKTVDMLAVLRTLTYRVLESLGESRANVTRALGTSGAV